jgi:Fur family ferric uptake transcriptional regulator
MADCTSTIGRAAYGDGRLSSQREAIACAARDFSAAFSADDLLAAVRREVPGVGIATVYRAVAAMEAAGFVEAVGARGSATLYVHCVHEGHHHHVVCTGCGAVADAECSVSASATTADGFAITGHDLTLYGLCPRCQA